MCAIIPRSSSRTAKDSLDKTTKGSSERWHSSTQCHKHRYASRSAQRLYCSDARRAGRSRGPTDTGFGDEDSQARSQHLGAACLEEGSNIVIAVPDHTLVTILVLAIARHELLHPLYPSIRFARAQSGMRRAERKVEEKKKKKKKRKKKFLYFPRTPGSTLSCFATLVYSISTLLNSTQPRFHTNVISKAYIELGVIYT